MIARQRSNLNRTFAQIDRPTVPAETTTRLGNDQKELADATAEFAAGIAARFGPVPALDEAVLAMLAATDSISQSEFAQATLDEELALARLIAARQNLRQILSSSSSSTACRTFDREQKQKFRLPEEEKANPKLAEELRELAKQEREFSSQCQAASGGGQPGQPRPSPASMAQEQGAAVEKADQLQQQAQADEALTDLARERMDAAADAVHQAAEQFAGSQPDEAGASAASAADQLDRLADQVAALKAQELAGKLAKARDLAERLAKEQQTLAESIQPPAGGSSQPGESEGQAAREATLSADARTLADILERFQTDAADENRELSTALSEAAQANSPAEAAAKMESAAQDLNSGRAADAKEAAATAQAILEGLASDLQSAHRGLTAAALQDLLAAEEEAAKTQESVQNVTNPGEQGEAEQKLSDLVETMRQLAPTSERLSEAADQLAQTQAAGGEWKDDGDPRGAYVPPQPYLDGLTRTIVALQAEIQEVILQGTDLDRDGAVPPEYKQLVEDYYKVLSEDLR